ncbi:hypothetical protein VF04_04250 [Nostoc linckia z7]|uniref:Uncharacterized protein n=2 Tax=Nostoc linckia TaxID=92942 RepID=A0A9Q5ZGH1_NOSLI|nr:hypothetical protein [Nostoc linckia]PHK42925.1 hypothetical protein VF12_00950 [Nostoc linckia z15]PHK48082.1 hypothetical protein VF13_01925 [Nostoc linckia z16]PHJ65002.1 hypothetical protein VF02_11735 [Nostoc linckia z1]PHJ70180.1 hypothetical protein VF05_11895 [Nostoc linckia z3]PHJ75081.1 hypothetical protein VF03_12055 [Nostoc linckia z2]
MINIDFTTEELQALSKAIDFVTNNPTRGVNEATSSAIIKIQSLSTNIEFTPQEIQGFVSAIGFLKTNPKSCWNVHTESAYNKLKIALNTYNKSQPQLLEVEIL